MQHKETKTAPFTLVTKRPKLPEAPMGQEGIAEALKLVTEATVSVYPGLASSEGGIPTIDRFITRLDQLHATPQAELLSLREKTASSWVFPRMLERCGIDKKTIKSALGYSLNSLIFYDSNIKSPHLFVDQSILGGFDNDNPIQRVESLLELGRTILKFNFLKAPQGFELEGFLRDKAKLRIRRKMLQSFDKLEPSVKEGSDARLAIAMLVMDQVIDYEDPNYPVRFFAAGGLTIMSLGQQDIGDGEVNTDMNFHTDSAFYLVEPVQARLLDIVSGKGYVQGRKTHISPDISSASLRAKIKHSSLGLNSRDESLRSFLDSDLIVRLIRSGI